VVREPKIRDAAQILREQLAELGFALPNQKSLDIAAKMKGYAGYQAYSAMVKDVPAPAVSSSDSNSQEPPTLSAVELVARQLAEHFGAENEWPRYPRAEYDREYRERDTSLEYWEWCVHQAEPDEDIWFYCEDAYVIEIEGVSREKDGWWWLTDADWRFLRDGTEPQAGLKFNGPFTTERRAKLDLAAGHPLTRQNFLGKLHHTAYGRIHTSR
jgi:hypothetical protein